MCAVHCVLCSVCIYVSKLVCITSVIKLLFFHCYSEIAFHTQCNLWIGPASESFQGCCSSLITTFNTKYCALCYVHLFQMEQCLLRWKSRMQYQNTFNCNNVSRIFLFVVQKEQLSCLYHCFGFQSLVVPEYFNHRLGLAAPTQGKMPLMSRGVLLS